jgi:hypothetical protein
LDSKDVIRLLRGVAETTDNSTTFNFEDTFENNLFKITGPFVPDNMEEAQTMPFQVMILLKACLSSVTKNIRNVVMGVRRWTKRLRGKGNDHAWSDFMVSKFQHHMEEGSYNRPLSDIEEIGDRVLQWGSHLDKKRVELRQYFPPSQTSNNNPSTSMYGPTGNKVNATGKSSQ